jgi:hypothetical protein
MLLLTQKMMRTSYGEAMRKHARTSYAPLSVAMFLSRELCTKLESDQQGILRMGQFGQRVSLV